jgi:transmembrane protein EpsG
MIGTLMLYLTVMVICMCLSYWSNKNKTKAGIYMVYLILILLSILRYDIGNDYNGYVFLIRDNASLFRLGDPNPFLNTGNMEPLIYVLTYIFQDAIFPYFWVLGVHIIITLLFLYKAFEDNDCHTTGIMIFFISGMLFANWDQVRQGVAIAIIIYAIKYIKEYNFKKYLLFIILAATAHYSALLLLPFYYFNKIKTRKYIYIAIIMTLAISNVATNYYDWLYVNLISYLPYFDTKNTSSALVQIVSSGYKIRIIFYSIVWSTTIFFLPEKERVLSNFLFMGAIIFILACGALSIMRIGFYFTFTMVLSIPIVLKIQQARTIMIVMVFGLLLFFVRDIITNSNTRGCVPYESIFSDKFARQSFRNRN